MSEEYISMLSDRDPRARRFALRRLGETASSSVIPDVRRATVDSDPMVAFQAGLALKEIIARSGTEGTLDGGTPGAAKGTMSFDPVKLRQKALDLLEPHIQRLGRLVCSGSTRLAYAAAAALGKIGDLRAAPFLAKGLKREDIAADCAMSLSSIKDLSCLDLLLDLVESRDDSLVQHAVFALAVFDDPRVTEALLGLLAHPDPAVRADAVLVLGTIGGGSLVPAIKSMLDDSEERVVLKALEALARFVPGFMIEYVSTHFASASSELKAGMVALLSRADVSDGSLSVLEAALDDNDSRVRANAVEVIGGLHLSAERRANLLSKLAGDRNNRVLANLAVALAPVDIVNSLRILSNLLNSEDKWERSSAVFAAGYIAEEKVAMWLANIFPLEEDPDVLKNMVVSLSRCGGPEIVSRMIQSLRHYNPLVRIGACRVLGAIARRNAGRSLIKEALFDAIAEESDERVLASLLRSVSALADASHIRRVCNCLRHASPLVQGCAVEVLDAIGTIEILPYVEGFIFSPDSRVKSAATLALWKQGHLDVIHVVGQMLDENESDEIASSAAFTFGEIGLTIYQLDDIRRSFLLVSALSALDGECSGMEEPGEVCASDNPDEVFIGRALPALAALYRGQTEQAAQLLRTLLSETPDEPRIHYLLGAIYRCRDDKETALEHLNIAARHFPAFLNLVLDLGSIRHETGDLPGALRAFAQGARTRASIVESLSGMVEDLLEKEQLKSASLTVRLIIESFSYYDRLHLAVGERLCLLGFPSRGLSHLTKALLCSPKDASVYSSLARACTMLGNKDLAARLLQVTETENSDA